MKETVKSFLQRTPFGTLITITTDGMPHATPMFMYVDDDLNCWCVTKEMTEKYNNILDDPNVVVSFVDRKYAMTAEVVGNAKVVLAGDEVADAITKLQSIIIDEHSGYWLPPVTKLDGKQHVVFKIESDAITFVDYSDKERVEPHRIELSL